MEPVIDRLRQEDLPGVAEIWNPVIRDTAITFTTVEKTPEDLRAWLASDMPRLALRRAGELAGFAAAAPFRAGPGYARTLEHTIFVAAGRRGRGEGAALMDALCEAARDAGAHSLIGGVSGENAVAMRFHEKNGFTLCGRIPEAGWKFGRWLDLVLYQRML